jgi:hypothetical protein
VYLGPWSVWTDLDLQLSNAQVDNTLDEHSRQKQWLTHATKLMFVPIERQLAQTVSCPAAIENFN